MKKEDLFDTLGEIDNQYIKEAHRKNKRKNNFTWAKWGAMAVCFAILVLCIPMARYLFRENANNTPKVENAEEANSHSYVDLAASKEEKTDRKEAVDDSKPESVVLVINKVDEMLTVALDIDVKITSSGELSYDAWQMILDEFQKNIGVSYDAFTASMSEQWGMDNFYFVSVPGEKKWTEESDSETEVEYHLHDYVFTYKTENGGEATIALCTYEEPLRDYFIKGDNPKKSEINGAYITIYEYENIYMTQFSIGNVNYDIELNNVSLDELETLLTSIITVTDSSKHAQSGSAPNTDIDDVPADSKEEYNEAVNSSDLPKDTSVFFGGSYTDANGKFVIVLTEDTPANRTAICKELGRSESNTTFVKGTYTLAYLTELQTKITNAMINKEIPFVVTSGVYETTNNIIISVTTNDEAELAKVYALDTIGGAIKVEFSAGAQTKELLLPKAE